MRSFRLRSYNVSSIGSQTREVFPGGLIVARFEAKMTMPDLEEDRWREHDGLLARLRGIDGTIRLWDAARPEPRYNALVARSKASWDDGTYFSDGSGWESGPLPPYVVVDQRAARGSNSLMLRGFQASLAAVLRPGDLFEARPNGLPSEHSHLYLVTRTSNTNADGKTRVHFEPGLRKSLCAGDQIVLGGGAERPMGIFRLASDDEGLIDVRAPIIGSLGLSFIEVLPHT